MNKIVSGILATSLAASFALSAIPAYATPAFVPQTVPVSADVQSVDYKPWMQNRNFGRKFDGNRNFGNRNFSRNHDGGGYWNGHRGSREYRRGYRRHGDYWFPLAAFATGALITGAIVNSENNRVSEGNSHVQWCYDHYRSYRASDNTFQPNNGPRRECRSPY